MALPCHVKESCPTDRGAPSEAGDTPRVAGLLQGLEIPVEAFSSLAACSSLHYLDISYNIFPSGIWQKLFVPGKKLQHLQFPDVSVVSLDTDSYDTSSLQLTAADVQRLVSCCPGLQQLRAHGTLHETAAISALSSLSRPLARLWSAGSMQAGDRPWL